MKSVREILPNMYRRARKNDAEQDLVLSCWAGAVGPEIARRTRATSLVRRKLTVQVDAPEWREQLDSLSQPIARRINGWLGRKVVRDIDFVLAPRKFPPRRAAAARPADDASGIEDPVLRRLYRLSQRRTSRSAAQS